MIYTVTLNPSLDYVMALPRLCPGTVNRAEATQTVPGGKGINVALMLRRLGKPATVWGFCGGYTGNEIRRLLAAEGIAEELTDISGVSRINVKIEAGAETELNAPGPVPPAAALEELINRVSRLGTTDTLVLSGRIPAGVPETVYAELLQAAMARGAAVVVDTSGEALRQVLPYHPLLIKPNAAELSELIGESLDSEEALFSGAARLQAEGAGMVLVSRDKDGALLLTEDGRRFSVRPPEGKVMATVGAGDSLVAGFLAAFTEKPDPAAALRAGVLAGSATAFSPWLAEKAILSQCRRRMPPVREIIKEKER